MTDFSRRGFLAAAGGAMAAAWLTADAAKVLAAAEHAARAGRESPPPPFQFLSATQAADLDAATSQIIPSDGSPGAREAHVVYFIDKSLATWAKDQRPFFAKGIAELRKRARKEDAAAKSFAELSDDRRRAVIASLEKDKHPFFFTLRGATITGMFANPEYGGNFNKQGWKLLGFDDRFSWAAPFGWYDANA
jgi:gluconate 2-dehydrogenase gamma chain